MQFIEMTGKTLRVVLREDELSPQELEEANVDDDTLVRVNRQGDIEVRRKDRWDVIGGLLGDFDHRLVEVTGLHWA